MKNFIVRRITLDRGLFAFELLASILIVTSFNDPDSHWSVELASFLLLITYGSGLRTLYPKLLKKYVISRRLKAS